MKKTLFTMGTVSLILTAAILFSGCGSAAADDAAAEQCDLVHMHVLLYRLQRCDCTFRNEYST